MKSILNVGIINPDWTVLRHNTDHVCVVDFANMQSHAKDLQLRFVGSRIQYFKANINVASQRLFGKNVLSSIPLRVPKNSFDVIYRYGGQINGLSLRGTDHPPLMTTVGYPSLKQDLARGEAYMRLRADQLEAETNDSALIHFHTDCGRELYLRHKPHHADRCITIPFFLPHLTFLTEEQVHKKFENPETLLIFVGSDGHRKGLAELCEALDLVAEELQERKLRAVVISKHVPSCKRFSAIRHEHSLPRNEVQALMREAHIQCMVPIKSESFGLVYVEAMAAGCAVVSDDDIPRQEILDHGRCGVLLPTKQTKPLAAALLDLVTDRAHTRSLALAGLARARVRYAPKEVAHSYAAALRRIAG